ncbi:MAG: thioredoxin domain-containing protein [Steroidobacteraceae bacterium]
MTPRFLRRPLLALLCGLVLPLAAVAADPPRAPDAPPPRPPANGATLPLPAGATVAVVIFEDLQCPDCAHTHPLLLAATREARVPLVIHDFPIPRHAWAFPAAVVARYYTNRSPELGLAYRTYIFEHQPDITPENLRSWIERFAAEHGETLPADVDPDGRLAAAVQADFDLGVSIGLAYVPLMFVIGPGTGAAHYVEIMDPADLPAAIEKVRAAGR